MGRRRRQLLVAEGLLLVGALGTAVATSRAEDWRPVGLFAILLGLTLASQAFQVRAQGVHISGAFLGLVLAMALLGPAPAVAIGVASIALATALRRPPPDRLLSNLATYAVFPLVGGLLLREATAGTGLREEIDFALVVTSVFLVTNLLNFVLIVGHTLYLQGGSLLAAFRRLYLPVFPWELTTAVATGLTAFFYERFGIPAIAIIAALLFGFQFLLRAVLHAEQRLEHVERLHEGLLAVLLHTLGLRDPMTARHSAAVARYSRELARAAGLPAEAQRTAHLAGLLHDIGKVIFTDAILSTETRLSDTDRELIREHPRRGAEIVRRVEGFEEIARVIEHHHERMDGQGYYGVPGDDVPVVSRLLSIADTYDVMTARDSYRDPVPHDAAVAELRAVAGTQLDGSLVEVFVAMLERDAIAFQHGSDADLEAEIRLVRGTALAA